MYIVKFLGELKSEKCRCKTFFTADNLEGAKKAAAYFMRQGYEFIDSAVYSDDETDEDLQEVKEYFYSISALGRNGQLEHYSCFCFDDDCSCIEWVDLDD